MRAERNRTSTAPTALQPAWAAANAVLRAGVDLVAVVAVVAVAAQVDRADVDQAAAVALADRSKQ